MTTRAYTLGCLRVNTGVGYAIAEGAREVSPAPFVCLGNLIPLPAAAPREARRDTTWERL